MSFGFSVSDITTLVLLTTRAYEGWKGACGEYTDITHDLNSLKIILSLVAVEVATPTSLLLHHDPNLNQIRALASNCKQVVSQLQAVISKYEGIVISRRLNWDRIKLGQKNLDGLRNKLTLQITALGTYSNILGLGALGRMETSHQELSAMKKVIDGVALEIRAGRRDSSVMTTYENDEKEVWRQFRRELIAEGFSSETLKKSKGHLRKYVRKIAEAGLLDEEVSEELEDALEKSDNVSEKSENLSKELPSVSEEPENATEQLENLSSKNNKEGCSGTEGCYAANVPEIRCSRTHLQPTVETDHSDTEQGDRVDASGNRKWEVGDSHSQYQGSPEAEPSGVMDETYKSSTTQQATANECFAKLPSELEQVE